MKLSEIRNRSHSLFDAGDSLAYINLMEYAKNMGLDTSIFHRELEMDSPFVDTYRDITRNNADVQLHSHTFYEILYCRSANSAEYLIGTDRYKLEDGDLIFVPPGISHRPILPSQMPKPYTRDVVWVNADFVKSLYKDGFLAKPFLLRTAGTKWEYLGELFHTGVLESESCLPDWEIAVMGNAFTLLSHLHRAFLDPAGLHTKAENSELLDQVMAYIEAHYSEHISLQDVARQFFVSDSTITQTFRKKMGVSFYRCVTQRRLIAAKAYIREGLTMDQVCDRVGFSDYSAFFRAFKQEFGISPSQYKKIQATPFDK